MGKVIGYKDPKCGTPKKIMQKGARFREIPNISHRNYILQLCKSIDKFVIKWSKKEKVPISTFDDWSKLLKMFIKSKFKSKGFADTEYISILNTNNVKDYIYEMHKKFVISPIDKASNNFAIICKKFYLEVIQGELGISEKIKGNSVYKPVNQNIDYIIEKHVDSIKNDFNINIKEVDKNIPLLYWVSKQHKKSLQISIHCWCNQLYHKNFISSIIFGPEVDQKPL